jgi:hypothetical protein
MEFVGTSDPAGGRPFRACGLQRSLAAKPSVGWADLEPYHLITAHRSSGNRTLLDAALTKSNIKLRWFYEVTNLSTSLGLVDALRDFSPAAHGDPAG